MQLNYERQRNCEATAFGKQFWCCEAPASSSHDSCAQPRAHTQRAVHTREVHNIRVAAPEGRRLGVGDAAAAAQQVWHELPAQEGSGRQQRRRRRGRVGGPGLLQESCEVQLSGIT